ncbi:MAG TPA: CarD family transcriptional regulator [Egibacteraceae bacterium]|jgi:CarD family transcriptional regulator|nr:CarD family transcriptional regulator [Egibacteraceae bacterium]
MTYARGDTVVHPQHGTATVEGMVSRDVGRGPEEYLELTIETPSLTIMVPAAAVQAVGIRELSTKHEAEAILAILEEPSDVAEQWSERNASTQERIRSQDLDQAAMVIRDLSRHQRRTGKPLTLTEKGLLDRCLDMVARELALVLDLSEDDTKHLIVEKSLNAGG